MSQDSRADNQLVAAVAAGEVAALEALYHRHGPWLQRRLQHRCADSELVDEALQDTFVAVWRSAGRYEPTAEVAAWLWGIAIRRLVSGLRQRSRFGLPSLSQRETQVASAEELVLMGIEHGALGTALQRLSPELRAVVQATILDGLTAREASRLLGIPTGTVKTRLARAKARLREDVI